MVRRKSSMTYLEQYREEIRKGNIIAGRELITSLDNYLNDISSGRYIYDTKEADRRISFIETFCKHSKAPFDGQPFILELWEKAFIEVLYSMKNKDTLRDRFRRALLLIARKNGKSTLCAALAFTELMIGGGGKDVICSANNDEQSKIIFEETANMAEMFDPNKKRVRKNRNEIQNFKSKSKVKRVSDRRRNILGLNIDFAICDETNELRDGDTPSKLIKSMSLKPNPKFINITTEGMEVDGYLDKELAKARAILAGERSDPASESLLIWLYTQDSEQEIWQDESTWQKSNPSYPKIKTYEYFREQIEESKYDKSERIQTLTFDFNIKVGNSEAWLMLEDYDYEQKIHSLEEFRDSFCLAAVDLAETTDLTNCKLLFMRKDDNTKYVFSHYWIPKGKLENSDDKKAGAKYQEWAKEGYITICDGNDNDLTLVADWIMDLKNKYNIRVIKCGYDVKFAKDFINRMDYYGIETEIIQQNAVVMSDPMKLVEADLKSRIINYSSNPVDKWCLGNASMQVNNSGDVLCVKINNQPSKRIDGAVTLIILYATFKRFRSEFMRFVK